MTLKTKFVIKSLLIGVFSTILFIGGGYFFIAGTFSNVNWMGGTTAPMSNIGKIYFFSGLVLLIIALALCPIFAVSQLKNVEKLTQNEYLRLIIFFTNMFMLVICCAICYCLNLVLHIVQ